MATTAVPATIRKRPSTRRASLTNTLPKPPPAASESPGAAREAGCVALPEATDDNMARGTR